MTTKMSDAERERSATIVALFGVLIHSWQVNEFAEAAEVKRELELLGVNVKLPRKNSGGRDESHPS